MATPTEIAAAGAAVVAAVGCFVDLEGSASSQHFIDTGAYLPIEELTKYAVEAEARVFTGNKSPGREFLMEFGARCIETYLRKAQTDQED